MTTEEYAYARARARRPVKVTLPSPLMLFLVWSPQRSRDAYPDPFEMFADGLRLMKEEAEELARLGCRYIQVDAPDFGQLVDPSQRDAWEQAGISVDRVFSEGADMLNELARVAGVSFGLHLCRGNYDSDWISTGTYETISKQLFQRATNYDTFLLEYDDERSGSFTALGDVPDDKTVVLGLVSTKFDRMEPADQLAARISEASGFFPLEQLALSTQCGFASAGPGNQISEDAQENKLRLVGEVADRVLGLGRLPGRALRHVLEDAAEVAEADGGVHALGHLGRLQARGPAAAVARVVRLGGGQRGAQPALAGPSRPSRRCRCRSRRRSRTPARPRPSRHRHAPPAGGRRHGRRCRGNRGAGAPSSGTRASAPGAAGSAGGARRCRRAPCPWPASWCPGCSPAVPARRASARRSRAPRRRSGRRPPRRTRPPWRPGRRRVRPRPGRGRAGRCCRRRVRARAGNTAAATPGRRCSAAPVGAASVRLPGSEQGIAAAQVEFGVGGAAHGSPDLALLTV